MRFEGYGCRFVSLPEYFVLSVLADDRIGTK